ERLIDSTVDAIIAADMRGQIILFNQGAERLFGYRARDVIGKKPVWELYDDDREVATVGILADLRDRIRMEQRLLDAQQKLQLSEKQALVAELAGAAAHELNQPLTSIIGYAQLIERQAADKAAAHLRAVGVILSEA